MKRLEKQLKALQDHLTNLSARADKARGQTRRRHLRKGLGREESAAPLDAGEEPFGFRLETVE
jgi:hypothetical protein